MDKLQKILRELTGESRSTEAVVKLIQKAGALCIFASGPLRGQRIESCGETLISPIVSQSLTRSQGEGLRCPFV